ncbi:MAG: hypothetical protein ACYC4L_12095 [Chloroflexota bacterium]
MPNPDPGTDRALSTVGRYRPWTVAAAPVQLDRARCLRFGTLETASRRQAHRWL